MRIAILTPTLYEFSGIDREVELQAKQYIQRGDVVSIFALDATIALDGASIIKIGMPKSLFWQRVYRLFFFLDVVKIVRCVGALRSFDVIYSHLYPMNILAAAAKFIFGKKYIYINNGIAPEETFYSLHEKIYIKAFRVLSNLTARYADQVYSISQYLADIFTTETDKKSLVQYIEVDRERFHPGVDGVPIRIKYSISDNPTILFIGRISPHKGVDLLIKSFHILLKRMPDAKLLIVGKHTFGAYSKRLKDIAGPSVIFTGFVSDNDLPEYYGACDAYATASLWEGFDMPLVEAQACGKPVVAFDIGPHKELIDDRGILVPPKDILQFSKALEKILLQ